VVVLNECLLFLFILLLTQSRNFWIHHHILVRWMWKDDFALQALKFGYPSFPVGCTHDTASVSLSLSGEIASSESLFCSFLKICGVMTEKIVFCWVKVSFLRQLWSVPVTQTSDSVPPTFPSIPPNCAISTCFSFYLFIILFCLPTPSQAALLFCWE